MSKRVLNSEVIARRGYGLKKPKPNFIKLMLRPKLNWKWDVQPEQRLCIEFTDALRAETLENKLKAVWFHVPNEGSRHNIVGAILKAMGMLPGIPDYAFLWEGGSGFIEFKAGKNGLSDWQEVVQGWCDKQGVKFALVRSSNEALDTLRQWGVLV